MTVGEGFVGIVDDNKDFEEHVKAAKEGISAAIEKIKSEKFNIVILDELNVAYKLGLINQEDIESLLKAKPPKQHLVITGRDAPDWLIDKADLVTEMKEIKHPYQKGIMAQKGVDW